MGNNPFRVNCQRALQADSKDASVRLARLFLQIDLYFYFP